MQAYVKTRHLQAAGHTIRVRIAEEDGFAFTVQLKVREQDAGQEHLVKFKVGIERHQTKTPSHRADIPHFQIDYYHRTRRKGVRAYFTLEVRDEQHLLDCVKGTLVVMAELLEQFGERVGDSGIVGQVLYADAIAEELSPCKQILIDVLHESFRDRQFIVRVDGITKTITTKRQMQDVLEIPEAEPIYLPLLKRIEEDDSRRI
ncbi:hypothetical protein AUJ68_06470 [Candidatus Woesearchaeota archaeon CG1_02_57_44]|nr:MAG: hypothetical protein AUJ68_06470 [Candidatus Woesearchaeota archaeon CG1_02_57_44]